MAFVTSINWGFSSIPFKPQSLLYCFLLLPTADTYIAMTETNTSVQKTFSQHCFRTPHQNIYQFLPGEEVPLGGPTTPLSHRIHIWSNKHFQRAYHGLGSKPVARALKINRFLSEECQVKACDTQFKKKKETKPKNPVISSFKKTKPKNPLISSFIISPLIAFFQKFLYPTDYFVF